MFYYLVIPFITLLAMWVFEYGTLTKRGSLFLHVIVRIVSFLLLFSLFALLLHYHVTNLFWYYAVNVILFAACVILFSESYTQIVFWFFTGWCFSSFISSICYRIAYWILPGHQAFTLRAVMYFSSFAVLLPVYFRYWRDRVRKMLFLFERENTVYVAFPIMAFVLFVILFGPFITPASFRNFWIMVLFIAFIVLMYFLLFMHVSAVFDRGQAETRLKDAEQQLFLQKKYYAEVDRGVRSQRKLLHDVRHHLITINYLAKGGDSSGILGYVKELIDNYGRSETKQYCENNVVNAIIGGYIEIAEEMGISVSAEIDIPQAIGIDEYDLCILFGNTIENALEACQRISPESSLYAKRSVAIRTRVEKDRLTVRIENTFSDKAIPVGNQPFSSKGARGGVGLESVRAVVEQNSGCMSCERQGQEFVFSAVLCEHSPRDIPGSSKLVPEM